MTVLLYLKHNTKKFGITATKQSQSFHNSVFIYFVQILMLGCMSYQVSRYLLHNTGEFKISMPDDFILFVVKLPCAVALHLSLYPSVEMGMNIMKLVSEHSSMFVKGSIPPCFLVGFLQFFTGVFCQSINLYMLTYQTKISLCIIHFVGLHVVMEIPELYFNSLSDNKFKCLFDHDNVIKYTKGD